MKYIKTYETKENLITPGKCWMIYGRITDIITVLVKIQYNYLFDEERTKLEGIYNRLIQNQDKILGILLYYSHLGFSYSIIKDENEKIEKIKLHTNAGVYSFEGEIKIENGNLAIDTIEKDLITYSL